MANAVAERGGSSAEPYPDGQSRSAPTRLGRSLCPLSPNSGLAIRPEKRAGRLCVAVGTPVARHPPRSCGAPLAALGRTKRKKVMSENLSCYRSPNRKHDQRFFYKYTTAKTTETILATRKLRWSSPLQFNDPFDVTQELRLNFEEAKLAKVLGEELAHSHRKGRGRFRASPQSDGPVAVHEPRAS